MSPAGELKVTDAHTHTVSTSADAGDVPDLRKKTRPVLDQRGTLTRDQSEKEESSEDEEETDKKCFVGDSLPPISRQKSNRTTSNSEEAHTSLVSKHKLTSRPLVSGLAHITESSNQEPLRTLLHHSRSDDERSTRDSTSDRHRHVRSTRSCRNRPSRLQQQLGSLPNASLQSLFSSLTTSSGSSGSLTATQNSYDKLAVRRHRPSKRRSAKESGSRSHARRPVNPSARSGAQRTRRTMDMNFATEVRDESRDVRANISRPASSASRASRKDSILSPPTPASRRASASSSTASASRGKSNVAWKRQETFNSDSGISVTSSPEESLARRSAHPSQKRYTDGPSDDDSSDEDDSPKGLVPTLRASSAAGMPLPSPMRALPDADPFVQRLQDQEAALKHHMLHSPQPKRSIRPQVNQLPSHHPSPALPLYDPRATSVPGLYPFHPPGQMLSANNHVHTHSDYDMEEYEPQSHGSRFQLDVNKKTVTGYEKLAEKLSQVDSSANQSQSFKPLYRQFKQLNHRILLHLQDEITELEEELRALDEAIAQTTGFSLPEASPIPPASRRAEARYGSELHYQRTQILGKVFMKMQQYNQALSTFSEGQKNFSPAAASDIVAYRSWLDEHHPLASNETDFVSSDHEGDLICPSAPSSSKKTPATKDHINHEVDHHNLKQVIVLLYVTMVLLLLAFSMLPGFFSKLILLLVVVGCMSSLVWRDLPIGHSQSIARSKKAA